MTTAHISVAGQPNSGGYLTIDAEDWADVGYNSWGNTNAVCKGGMQRHRQPGVERKLKLLFWCSLAADVDV